MSHDAIPPLDDTLGAIEIGGILGTFLFGIGTLQTFYYYGQFPHGLQAFEIGGMLSNRLGCEQSVSEVLSRVIELGHTISTWHAIYSVTVTFYGQSQYLERPPHSLDMTILFFVLIIFIIQVFFAHRIRKLSGKWSITIICWVLTFLRAVCISGLLGITWHIKQISELQERYRSLMVSSLTLGAMGDVLIAASLCYCLRTMRTSEVDETRRMVDTLVLWTIADAVVIMTILLVLRNDFTWVLFYLILGKAFSNSFLASLNGRQRFRALKRNSVNVNTGPYSSPTSPSLLVAQPNRGVVLEMSTITVADFNLSKDVEEAKH